MVAPRYVVSGCGIPIIGMPASWYFEAIGAATASSVGNSMTKSTRSRMSSSASVSAIRGWQQSSTTVSSMRPARRRARRVQVHVRFIL